MPDLPLKGESLSAVKYEQNISKSRSFKVGEFCDKVFFTQIRQKRRKSFRIYEYFNEICGEKTIPKSDSDMLHPLYAKDNLISRYKIANFTYVDYTYDSLNRLKMKTLSTSRGNLYTEYFYKPSQRNSDEGTTKYTTTQLGREIVDNTAFTYYYDSVGNITRVLRSYKNQGVDKTAAYKSYAYDTENQLIREDNKEANQTFVFDYDDLGNISSKTIYNHTSPNVTPTTAQKTIKYDYDKNGPNGWNHLLVGVDSDGVEGFGDNETITYDEIGNPEKYLGATLVWYGRQLQSYTKDGVEFTYTYDTDGLRATKDVNGVNYTYHYVGGQLRYETRGDEKFYYFYDASGVISGFRYVDANGTAALYYTFTNSQGDVVAIYNQNGGWVGSYEYDAWGNVVKMVDGGNQVVDEDNTTQIISKNAIRYRGYYYDEETKFYYLQSRYYNPAIGRFINADAFTSTAQGILGNNMFAYCNNNPVRYADSVGYYPLQTAFEFLERWLTGDGSEQKFTEKDKVTKKIKKSSQMQSAIDTAIEQYKEGQTPKPGSLHFTPDDGGYELYLGIQHCSYSITVTKETKTTGFWFWKKEKTRYVATVTVSDIYNFDEIRDWNSFGSIANNLAYIYNLLGGGHDYEWTATFTQTTKWETNP